MKIKNVILVTTVFSCMMVNGLLGQAIQKPGQYKVGRHIISVKEISTYHSFLITEDDSVIWDFKDPRSLIKFEGMKYAGPDNVYSAFVKVLGAPRIKEFMSNPKAYIDVTLYPIAENGKGKVVAVRFIIFHPEEISLTPEEFHHLTIFIKKHITLSLPPDVPPGTRMWPFDHVVKFSKLLD